MTQHATVLTPSFYISQKDLSKAITAGIDILKGESLKKDDQGFCLIDDLCEKIKEIEPSLKYINRNHIIELFFKDRDRKVLISGLDKIKYKEVKYVQPPETLYFGTVEALAPKMLEFGVRSNTKGYIKLYSTPERACDFAKKFAREGDKLVSLSVKAGLAFSEGLKFSTFQEGEYIAVQINRRYLS
jgi:RNA:NAD 2'-phosphotransferase (TPT1/KptA family)